VDEMQSLSLEVFVWYPIYTNSVGIGRFGSYGEDR